MKPVLVVSGDTQYLRSATLHRVGHVYIIRCYHVDKGNYTTARIYGTLASAPYVFEDGEWKSAAECRNGFTFNETWVGDGVVFGVDDIICRRSDIGAFSVSIVHPRSTMLQVVAHTSDEDSATIVIATDNFVTKSWDVDNLIDSYLGVK